jgi:Major Facilitator Superfamily
LLILSIACRGSRKQLESGKGLLLDTDLNQLTVFIALIGYIGLVGFPDQWSPKWRFLNEREVKFIIDRVDADRGDAQTEPFNLGKYLRAGLDWKIWAFAMIFFNTTTISYALAYFLPDILKDSLHFTPKMTQILTAPPYVFGGCVMILTGWIGDRYRIRGPLVVFNMLLCITGIPVLGWVKSPSVKYFAIFLLTAGANSNVPTTMTYQV